VGDTDEPLGFSWDGGRAGKELWNRGVERKRSQDLEAYRLEYSRGGEGGRKELSISSANER